MSSTTILISTDADGAFEYERPFFGLILAAQLQVGDLVTDSLDVVISDATRDVEFHEFGELTADAYYQPASPFPVYGNIAVSVTSGGDTKHGSIRLMTET